MSQKYLVLICSVCLSSMGPMTARGQITLTDMTSGSGLDFQHTDGSRGHYYFIESMTGGLALFDYDLDGDDDIYLLNGSEISPDRRNANRPSNALFRNNGDWTFTDVTEQAGVGDTGFGLGVASADYDNDGAPDLYVNNYGENVLYHNNGDGSFTNVTQFAAVAGGDRAGGGVCFLDLDNDGDLDLYVANYVRFDVDDHQLHMHKGLPAYPSPLRFEPERDMCFANQGDGTFVNVSKETGVNSHAGRGMGAIAFDYDRDGDCDIVVCNDSEANFLYENLGDGTFDEAALLAGIAYDFRGASQASMGIDVLDFNRDGQFDLFATSLNNEYATLYRNLGGGILEDATRLSKAGSATYAHVTWGVVAGDLDLDGDPDLFIGAGHLDDRFSERGGNSQATDFRVRNIMLENVGHGQFRDLGSDWGTGAEVVASSRGVAGSDLDRDGDLDIVVLNTRGSPTLLRNDTPRRNRDFVALRLVGREANRSAAAAMVRISEYLQGAAKQENQYDVVVCGSSYQSDSSMELLFGVDAHSQRIEVAITWSGETKPSQVSDVALGQRHVLLQQR